MMPRPRRVAVPRKVVVPISPWPIRYPVRGEVDEERGPRVQALLRRVSFPLGPRTVTSLQSSMPATVSYTELEAGCLALVKSGEWTRAGKGTFGANYGPIGVIEIGMDYHPELPSDLHGVARSIEVGDDEGQ
jgi:hypothetical protein